MKPSLAEENAIFAQVTTMRTLLQTPATIHEIETQFSLLAGGLKMAKGGDSLNTAAAYLIAMEGFSSWATRRCVRDILRGVAEGFSKTFMPSSAELATYCAILEKKADITASFVEKLLSAPEEIKGEKNKIEKKTAFSGV